MDWFSFLPPFFGVLAAFGLDRLVEWVRKYLSRRNLLRDLREELGETGNKLTGAGSLLYPDIWDSAISSGQIRLLKSEQIRKLARVYSFIKGTEYEATRLRDAAEDFRKAPTGILIQKDGSRIETPEQIWQKKFLHKRWTDYSGVHLARETELRGKIDEILKETWWKTKKMEKQEVTEKQTMSKQRSFTSYAFKVLVLLMLILVFLPFAVTWLIHGNVPSLDDVSRHFMGVRPNIVRDVLSGAVQGIALFFSGAIYVALIIVASALLFDVTWKRKRLMRSRTSLHVYIGYFLTLLLLLLMFASEILGNWNVTLWGTAGASTLTLLAALLGLTIFGARIMSKLPIKIEDTNLGSFVIVIYISYAIFRIWSQGFNPLLIWAKLLNTELVPSYANAFFLFSLPAILAFALTILDVFLITQISDGKL